MKNTLLSLFTILLVSSAAAAQSPTNDKTAAFAACSKIKYTADNKWLKEKIAVNLAIVDTAASYTGGIDELKKYFAQHRLADPKSRRIIFTVRIAFIVNCKGIAGDFEPLIQHQNKLRPMAADILKTVKSMPQNWKPAIKDKKETDSYQILEFIVINGYLDKVSYK